MRIQAIYVPFWWIPEKNIFLYCNQTQKPAKDDLSIPLLTIKIKTPKNSSVLVSFTLRLPEL